MIDSPDDNAAPSGAGTEEDPTLAKEKAAPAEAGAEEGAAPNQDDTVAKLIASPSPTKCRGLPIHGTCGSQEQEGKSTRERVFCFLSKFQL